MIARIKKYLADTYIGLVIFFLYAPILVLVVLSFNASKSRSKWGGFTLDWYRELFSNEEIISALWNTLLIAFLSAIIATVIGTMAAIGMDSMKKKNRSIWIAITNIPMLNAEIVTGISLMLIFMAIGLNKGFLTVLIAHITFNIPYVILSVMPKLRQMNIATYEAARDLGASPWFAFHKVVLPDLFPGIFSGFLMALTMSMDDFVITHFTRGASVHTLSTKIYAEVRKGIQPEMYALSTLLFVSVLILLVIINIRDSHQEKVRRERNQ